MPTLSPELHERVMRHSMALDSSRRYITDAPTPEKMAQWLKTIDEGDLAAAVEICEEMEAKDAHLQGVANRRRQAITGVPWDVLPNPDTDDQDMAEKTAEYVRKEIKTLTTSRTGNVHSSSFSDMLKHLSTAIGPGLAVSELVWSGGRLVKSIDIPGDRLVANNQTNQGVYVLTDDNPQQGIEAIGPKWVVHTPHIRSGYPLRVTLMRASVWLFVMKHAARADWSGFNEVFGQPVRTAQHPKDMPDDDKTLLANMLRDMGSDLWALFPEGVTLEFKEAGRGSQPYLEMIEWIERKQAILWLGQTLTTEPSKIGALALGEVHDDVRAALTLDDYQSEADMVRDQIFRPMIEMRWRGLGVPVPIFRRRAIESRNLDAERLDLEKFRFMHERNLRIDDEVIYDRLGIPQPKDAVKTS